MCEIVGCHIPPYTGAHNTQVGRHMYQPVHNRASMCVCVFASITPGIDLKLLSCLEEFRRRAFAAATHSAPVTGVCTCTCMYVCVCTHVCVDNYLVVLTCQKNHRALEFLDPNLLAFTALLCRLQGVSVGV